VPKRPSRRCPRVSDPLQGVKPLRCADRLQKYRLTPDCLSSESLRDCRHRSLFTSHSSYFFESYQAMVHAAYVPFMQSMPVHKSPSTLSFHPLAPLSMQLSRCKLHLERLECPLRLGKTFILAGRGSESTMTLHRRKHDFV